MISMDIKFDPTSSAGTFFKPKKLQQYQKSNEGLKSIIDLKSIQVSKNRQSKTKINKNNKS